MSAVQRKTWLMMKHRWEDPGSLLRQYDPEGKTQMLRRRWQEDPGGRAGKMLGQKEHPAEKPWGQKGLGTFQKQNLGWCSKSLQEKSTGAGGEIREAGRGLTMADFVGRIRSLVLTPKAIEATRSFSAGESCDLICILKSTFFMRWQKWSIGWREGSRETS